MAKILDLRTRQVFNLDFKKGYELIGRQNECRVKPFSDYVSRYHATLFKSNGDVYLLNHSINGTFYPIDEAGIIEERTRLENSSESQVVAEYKERSMKTQHGCDSHLEAAREQFGESVPRIIDFEPHKFKEFDDIAYLMNMIQDPEQRELLVPIAKVMKPETYLGITRGHRYLYFG